MLTIESLRLDYTRWAITVDVVDAVFAQIAASPDPAVWISRARSRGRAARGGGVGGGRSRAAAALGRAVRGEGQHRRRRAPTTAGVSGRSRTGRRPTRPRSRGSAPPARLVIGKTNLDQFATGLVGVRSPYGMPRNACSTRATSPGGSSSGSAVAVARGLVAFALGTDTAGSGRVPAAFNHLVGVKPTRGLIGTAGVVPACRSLDCRQRLRRERRRSGPRAARRPRRGCARRVLATDARRGRCRIPGW